MKKIIVLFIFTVWALVASAQTNVEDMYKEFSKYENVESVHVNPLLMALGRLFMEHNDVPEIARRISSVSVLSVEKCSKEVRDKFNMRMEQLEASGYEVLTRVRDDGEDVKILAKLDEDVISEMLILISADKPALVQLKGEIKMSDIDELVNKYASEER